MTDSTPKNQDVCEHGATMPLGKSGITTRAWCYICGAMGSYKDGQTGPMEWRLPIGLSNPHAAVGRVG